MERQDFINSNQILATRGIMPQTQAPRTSYQHPRFDTGFPQNEFNTWRDGRYQAPVTRISICEMILFLVQAGGAHCHKQEVTLQN